MVTPVIPTEVSSPLDAPRVPLSNRLFPANLGHEPHRLADQLLPVYDRRVHRAILNGPCLDQRRATELAAPDGQRPTGIPCNQRRRAAVERRRRPLPRTPLRFGRSLEQLPRDPALRNPQHPDDPQGRRDHHAAANVDPLLADRLALRHAAGDRVAASSRSTASSSRRPVPALRLRPARQRGKMPGMWVSDVTGASPDDSLVGRRAPPPAISSLFPSAAHPVHRSPSPAIRRAASDAPAPARHKNSRA